MVNTTYKFMTPISFQASKFNHVVHNSKSGLTLKSSINRTGERKALSSDYPSTAEAKEVRAPQIAAQNPSDKSVIRAKHAPVSG